MDVDESPLVVRHKTWCEDAHETCQHHEVGLVLVDLGYQGSIKGFAGLGLIGEGFVVDHSRGNAVLFGNCQTFGLSFVADDGTDAGIEAYGPVLFL